MPAATKEKAEAKGGDKKGAKEKEREAEKPAEPIILVRCHEHHQVFCVFFRQ